MNCEQVERLLSHHLEGLISDREGDLVETHLVGCSACGRLQGEFQRLRSRLRGLALEIPEAEVEIHAIDLWLAERGSSAGHWRHGFRAGWRVPAVWRLAFGGAAVALLLAVFAFYGWDRVRLTGASLSQLAERPRVNHGRDGFRSTTSVPPHEKSETHRLPAPPRTTGYEGTSKESRSGPSTDRPQDSVVDDLVLFNRDPKEAVYPWVRLDPREWEAIEARVRRDVKVRDDFVTIPLPRIASTSDRLIAQALESYKREAAIVDARLSHEVTCAYKATALSELCDQLRNETGIQLSAGPSVADEKVTLFCKKMPLRDVMRQFSRPFGYAWLRTRLQAPNLEPGAGSRERGSAAYRYELVQDLRSQLLEEELRNQDRNQALLDMEQQAKRYRAYLELSPEEALARAATAPAEEKEILKHYAGKGWGPAQMYSRLTPADMAALLAGQRLTFSASPEPGQQLLPQELARNVIVSLRDYHIVRQGDGYKAGPVSFIPEGEVPAAFPEAQPIVSLNLIRSELGQISLQGWSGFLIGTPPDTKADLMGDGERMIAEGISPAVRNPRNAVANAAHSNDPGLRPRISVRPRASQRSGPAPSSVAASGAEGNAEAKVTSADVLEALHRATGMNIVSDYYTRLFPSEAVSVGNQPLFDVLNHLADAMRMRWTRESGEGTAARSGAGRGGNAGGWLQFRTTSYFNDRLKEVPNRLLNRWAAARRRNGALTVEELVEIAGLSDTQLNSRTMAEGARVIHGLMEWQLAGARAHWRYLAGFTPEQRRTAQSPSGFPFRQMSLAQQQRFIQLALDSSSVRLDLLDELAEGSLQVDYLPPVGFQLQFPKTGTAEERGLAAPRARGETREAALQAARRIDPNVTPDRIVPAEMSVTFTYRLGGPNARVTPMIAHLDTRNFVGRRPQPVPAAR